MSYPRELPSLFKIVDATAGPVTTNGGVTLAYVSLKNAHKVWVVLQFTQAVGHATTVQPKKATAIAGTGVTNITVAAKIWANEDTATNDTLVVKTPATSYAVTNDIKKKIVIVEIDPDTEWGGTTFDVLGCTVSDSTQATNFVSGLYIIATRYPQATPPTAVTD